MITLSSINFNTSSSSTSWKNLLDLVYPKGSVYYRTASAAVPGVSFGGNWEIKNYDCPNLVRLNPSKGKDNSNATPLKAVYQLGSMVFGYGWFTANKNETGSWGGLEVMSRLPGPDETGWSSSDSACGVGVCGLNNSERVENLLINRNGVLVVGANGGYGIQANDGGPYNFMYKAKNYAGLDKGTFFSERIYQHIRTS